MQDVVKRAQKDATKGKSLLDELKRKAETLIKTNPKSDRLQPYKSQYMRLCKLYVEVMKDHQKSKVRVDLGSLGLLVSLCLTVMHAL